MDISSVTTAAQPVSTSTVDTTDEAHVLLLKKAIYTQAESALTLIQSLPANLPLETSGNLGTNLNMLA